MTRESYIGNFGEEFTRRFLEKKGYKILERNFRKPYGEVDIICKKEDLICFVEVKTRSNQAYGQASEAVDSYKRERIRRTAQAYIQEKSLYDYLIRFDVSEVYTENREIHYIENAF